MTSACRGTGRLCGRDAVAGTPWRPRGSQAPYRLKIRDARRRSPSGGDRSDSFRYVSRKFGTLIAWSRRSGLSFRMPRSARPKSGGVIGDLLGWREISGIAAAIVALPALAVRRLLPNQSVPTIGTYAGLLRSFATLTCRYALLRKALARQALLAATLVAFWSTLALMLAGAPFHGRNVNRRDCRRMGVERSRLVGRVPDRHDRRRPSAFAFCLLPNIRSTSKEPAL